jgi:hypothetical protein
VDEAALWNETLPALGRGGIVLATAVDKEALRSSARRLGMHPIWVDLVSARNLSAVTYEVGSELLLDVGPISARESSVVDLDTFRDEMAQALETLANDQGHVVVLDSLDRFRKSDPQGFRRWVYSLVDVFNTQLGWYSDPVEPSKHLFDRVGPAWIVIIVASAETLEDAEKLLEAHNNEITGSPHYWISEWSIPVPIVWVPSTRDQA